MIKFFLSALTLCLLFSNPSFANLQEKSFALLEAVSEKSNNESLYTQFQQEKYLSFLEEAIETRGYLFFDKNKDILFWEYESPSLSGIWYNKGEILIWSQTYESIRKPQSHEKDITRNMLEELNYWLNIERENVQAKYSLSLVDTCSLLFVPKRKGLFSSVLITFTQDLQSIEELIFYEDQENFTKLLFENTEFNLSVEDFFQKRGIQEIFKNLY